MKYKVLKRFIDKETSKKYEVDAEYPNQKRGNELVELGYLKEIQEKKPRKSSKKGEVNES